MHSEIIPSPVQNGIGLTRTAHTDKKRDVIFPRGPQTRPFAQPFLFLIPSSPCKLLTNKEILKHIAWQLGLFGCDKLT